MTYALSLALESRRQLLHLFGVGTQSTHFAIPFLDPVDAFSSTTTRARLITGVSPTFNGRHPQSVAQLPEPLYM